MSSLFQISDTTEHDCESANKQPSYITTCYTFNVGLCGESVGEWSVEYRRKKINFGIKITRTHAKRDIKMYHKTTNYALCQDVLNTNYVPVSLTEQLTGNCFGATKDRVGWSTFVVKAGQPLRHVTERSRVTIIVAIHTYHKWTPAFPKPIPAKQLASCICDRASVSPFSFTAL